MLHIFAGTKMYLTNVICSHMNYILDIWDITSTSYWYISRGQAGEEKQVLQNTFFIFKTTVLQQWY